LRSLDSGGFNSFVVFFFSPSNFGDSDPINNVFLWELGRSIWVSGPVSTNSQVKDHVEVLAFEWPASSNVRLVDLRVDISINHELDIIWLPDSSKDVIVIVKSTSISIGASSVGTVHVD